MMTGVGAPARRGVASPAFLPIGDSPVVYKIDTRAENML